MNLLFTNPNHESGDRSLTVRYGDWWLRAFWDNRSNQNMSFVVPVAQTGDEENIIGVAMVSEAVFLPFNLLSNMESVLISEHDELRRTYADLLEAMRTEVTGFDENTATVTLLFYEFAPFYRETPTPDVPQEA